MKIILRLIITLLSLTMLLTSCRLSEESGKLSEAMDAINESNATVEESSIDNHLSTESEELTEISEHEESDNEVKVGTGWGDEGIGLRYISNVEDFGPLFIIIDYKELDNYLRENIEAVKFEKRPYDDLPYLFKAIEHFDISKEELLYANAVEKEAAEKGNGKGTRASGHIYTDEVIELLYCGDLERIKRELTHETAWYDNGNVYSFGELYDMSKAELKAIFETQGELDRFTEKVTPFILKHDSSYIDFLENMECRYKS